MKHLKPVTKAQSTLDAGEIISMVLSLLTALAPIIEYLVSSQKNQEV